MRILVGDEAQKRLQLARSHSDFDPQYYDYEIENGVVVIRMADRECVYLKTCKPQHGTRGSSILLAGTADEFEILARCLNTNDVEEMIECSRSL